MEWIDYRDEKDVTKIPSERLIELFADEAYALELHGGSEARYEELKAEALRRMEAN
jgi:hypothetical protein